MTLLIVFLVNKFKAAFLKYVISDNLILCQNFSRPLWQISNIFYHSSNNILLSSYNTTCLWILKAFDKEKTTIQAMILNAQSKISISFDKWQLDQDLLFLGVVRHFLDRQL